MPFHKIQLRGQPFRSSSSTTVRSERAHLTIRLVAGRAGSLDLPWCFNLTPDSEGPPYVEHTRGGLFQDGDYRLKSHYSPFVEAGRNIARCAAISPRAGDPVALHGRGND